MIRFNNDYNHGAHPKILEALAATNGESYAGYGLDPWCEKAADLIRSYLGGVKAGVHFLEGGTQANLTVITAALRPFQSVICADSGHINVHETGAIEHCGHKIQALPAKDGKITAAQIAAEAELYRSSSIQEHIPQPKLVYLSHPTEFGTIYTREELAQIRKVCTDYGLLLFVDGARLGYGLGSAQSDLTLADFARLCDVFYIGGTKCGALFGEAVVIPNPALNTDFRSYIKQAGAMLAKGWLLGLQFCALFEDGLYFRITRQADSYAARLREAFLAKQIPLYIDSPTNQQFVVLSQEDADRLARKYTFEFEKPIDASHICVRFCTSWSTTESEIEELIRDIRAL